MTGIYLFGKDKDGKRTPMEIEYLTQDERHASLKGKTAEELVGWIDALCDTINQCEEFIVSEGYVKHEPEE
jgi:hypothetical protein